MAWVPLLVHVEIRNGDAFHAVLGQCVRGSDGDAVEQAETHRFVARRVMARRPYGAECALRFAAQYGIGCRNGRAGRAQRGFQ
jgi:hypothetical protein